MGDGLYGVDLKQQGARTCAIEVNANPDIDSECEAALPASRLAPAGRLVRPTVSERGQRLHRAARPGCVTPGLHRLPPALSRPLKRLRKVAQQIVGML